MSSKNYQLTPIDQLIGSVKYKDHIGYFGEPMVYTGSDRPMPIKEYLELRHNQHEKNYGSLGWYIQ